MKNTSVSRRTVTGQNDATRLYTALGAMNGLTLTSSFGLAARAQLLRQIKQEDLYKAVATSWEEFCADFLPFGRSTADNLIRELDRLGEDFMNAAEQLNLGQRQMVALAGMPSRLLPRAEGDEIVVGDERVPLSEKDRVVQLLEELVAGQEKLTLRIEQGEEQLAKKSTEARELKDQLKRIEDAQAGRVTEEYDRLAIQAIKALRAFADCLSDPEPEDRPHPDVVLNYYNAMGQSISEIAHYAGQYVTPEWATDPDLMKAHMKEVLEKGPQGAATARHRADEWGDEDKLL